VPARALAETLSPERCINLLFAPINLNLATIYILIDRHHPFGYLYVRLLALLQHLEHQIPTDGRVIRIAKMLVNPLLQGLNALAQFFGIM